MSLAHGENVNVREVKKLYGNEEKENREINEWRKRKRKSVTKRKRKEEKLYIREYVTENKQNRKMKEKID